MRMFMSLLLLLAVAMPALAQDATYRYEAGKEYKYLIEETGLQIQEFQGQSRTSNTETTISTVLTVEEALENGHLKLKSLVENALIIAEGPEQTQTLGDEASGKSVIFEIDERGDIVDVDSSVKELERIARSVVMGTMRIFPALDKEKLTLGNEWEVEEADTSGSGESQIITESESIYKVKREKEINGHACLEIVIETEADFEGKRVAGDQEMMISGTQESKTKLYYSPSEGIVVQIESDTNSDQTLMLTMNNMRVPITGNQTVKVTLVSP